MDNNKTLTSLYLNGRYRLAKVVYIFLYGIALFIILVSDGGPRFSEEFFGPLAVTIAIFEFIKRAFYYVALGTVKPDK